MKDVRSCGIWTRSLVYLLIAAVTLMYMPLAELASAQAASGPRVYVLGIAADGDSTPLSLKGKTEALLMDKFGSTPKLTLVSNKEARELLKGGGGAAKPKAASKGIVGDVNDFERAKKYLDRANRYFKKGSYDRVLKYAERAVKNFKRTPNHIKDYDLVKQAYILLAVGYAETDGDAVAALKQVLAFDKSYEPTGDYEDILLDAYDTALEAKRNGRLEIDAYPDGAKVLVNGKAHSAPVNLRGLVPGDYYIRVSADGFDTYDNVVKVKGTEKLSVVLGGGKAAPAGDSGRYAMLQALKKKAMKQDFDKAFYNDAEQLGQWLKVEYIFIGAFKSDRNKSTFYPLVFRVNDAKMAQVKPVTMSNDLSDSDKQIKRAYIRARRAMTETFPALILAPGFVLGEAVAPEPEPEPAPVVVATPEPEPEPEPVAEPVDLTAGQFLLSADDAAKAQEDSTQEETVAPEEKTPVWKEWWFWTIIGVVVVGGGVTAGVMLQPENQDQPSRLVLP